MSAAASSGMVKGQDSITLVADAVERRAIFVEGGRGAEVIEAFATELESKGGDPAATRSVSIDLSLAFTRGVTDRLPMRASHSTCSTSSSTPRAHSTTRGASSSGPTPNSNGPRWSVVKHTGALNARQ
jgi:hypothetical protein